jgi:hypothetical protein
MNIFNNLKNNFPDLKLPSYESINKLDNKTTSLFIPEGYKCFAWFIKYENNPICLFWDKNDQSDLIFRYVCFSDELTKGTGTIVYGTLLNDSFYCENIYYLKGKTVTGNSTEKFIVLKTLFQDIHFSNFLHTIHFYLPFMGNTKVIYESTNQPYNVDYILQISNNKYKIFKINDNIGSFKIVKRKEYEDVYELWVLNKNETFEFYSTALVNNIKTSNFLKNDIFNLNINYKNTQFLNENDLEVLEWNFDENQDFFVGCIYIQEFRKWKPIIKKSYADNLTIIKNVEKKIFS